MTADKNIIKQLKDSMFGNNTGFGHSYRFFNKTSYLVLNGDESIVLYKRERAPGNEEGKKTSATYYFSKDADSPIFPLTFVNLKTTFDYNETFLEFLYAHFKNDAELIEYDNDVKMYKLNMLLDLSNKLKGI